MDSLDKTMAHGKAREDVDDDEKEPEQLDEDDVDIMRTYGVGPYVRPLQRVEKENKDYIGKINKLIGVKESDTGLAPPSQWDLEGDKQMMKQEQPLQVARCTKIIDPGTDDTKYIIKIREFAKFVVGLGEKVSATDIDEGMRVGVDTSHGGKYRIQIPLPPKIDPSVTMMTVEEKPDVTYNDVGGAKEQLERLREVIEMPLLQPERFVALGIDPPKGVLLYGPPGTGKTLTARAVANRTDACFICVIGSELVQRYVGEGARMVRELFQLARTKKACILFIDEVDAIGGSRGGDEGNSDSEVQRTMLEIVNQLDGFEARGNVKILMATNRPDTLDPALLRPGRQKDRVRAARSRWPHAHLQDQGEDDGPGHPLRAARSTLPQHHRGRADQRVHRGGDVRHPRAQEEHLGEGPDRCDQQSGEGLLKVLGHPEVHGLQLRAPNTHRTAGRSGVDPGPRPENSHRPSCTEDE
ncbi:unnamed protein product [Prorocentrum cordatum]|uniref:AAA+ ATPase domain-containing protein n=1 Tax=Prorocentrum cordatum TaxID=2364126 RepID=A0ABN9UFU8_9DINO|nr:unnamed protein product [Polarella glacialis]